MIILPSRNVGVQCHHQICWRHYVTAQLTSLRNKQAYNQYWKNKRNCFSSASHYLIFCLFCQTLNEYLRLHYWELTSHLLSTSVYVNKMFTQINQRLYLLSQLKLQVLNIQALHTLFTGLIMSKIMYALPAFAGQLKAETHTGELVGN